jgi:hypothetical protein
MDCTPFIRTRWVLAAWLTVPLLLLVTISMAGRSFHHQQCTSLKQKIALSQMVPNMQNEANAAEQFLSTCRLEDAENASAQDRYYSLINTAALNSGFEIETIYLDQETIDFELKTARLTISLLGTGTSRQAAEFLQQIQIEDPMLFTGSLQLLPSGKAPDILTLEADLVKVYAQ